MRRWENPTGRNEGDAHSLPPRLPLCFTLSHGGEGLITRFPGNPAFLGTTQLEMLLLVPKELTPHPESLREQLFPNHDTSSTPDPRGSWLL